METFWRRICLAVPRNDMRRDSRICPPSITRRKCIEIPDGPRTPSTGCTCCWRSCALIDESRGSHGPSVAILELQGKPHEDDFLLAYEALQVHEALDAGNVARRERIVLEVDTLGSGLPLLDEGEVTGNFSKAPTRCISESSTGGIRGAQYRLLWARVYPPTADVENFGPAQYQPPPIQVAGRPQPDAHHGLGRTGPPLARMAA